MEAGPVSAVVGRFAPSPSGRLHLGNLACSLLAWLSARSRGGRIVLRIEDLDAERCPRKYADQLEEDLGWLGLFWDEGGSKGGPHEPYYQSECSGIYTESYKKLEAMGLVYPCFCSRSQLHAASAPHTSDGNVIYPGTCRGLTAEEIAEKRKKKAPAYRLMVPDENIAFTDGCMGEHTENLLRDCGDFYLRRADGVFAYQLAVVVDDARMGVTEVVRGADLLSSTARQLYLYRLLDLPAPKFAHCPLLLASATPSVESYYFAKRGIYTLLEMHQRYNQTPLPHVEVVDMQEERTLGKEGVFSETLAQALRENFEAGSQSLLLLNRRGYHTIISCASCNQPVYCPNCSIPMTYHKVNNSLMCHYCGHTQDMVETCPSCGGKHLRKMGFGTQRLEEELRLIVPEARILRMDADTTMSRYAYEERFQEFRQGKYDIMLGTQMIGKGLDFPNVTLVGVLSVDKALYAGDFRSYERTFSLITQVVGRGGRGEKAGRAILQTSMPEHYVLRLAAQQAYPAFYEQEIALRRQLIFPPICDICVVGFTGMREPDVRTAAMHTADVLKDQIRKTGFSYPIWVLEPVPCVYGRINGKYRYQLVIKCKNTKPYRDLIHAVLTEAGADRSFARVHLYADMNGDVGI